METALTAPADTFTFATDVAARQALRTQRLALRVLAPPYPAAGVGALRVLRVRERNSVLEITAGYERYDRLDLPADP